MLAIAGIKEMAAAVGLDACGVARADILSEDAAFLEQWLAAGKNASMAYMERNREKRTDPRKLVPGCRTVVVCLLSYFTEAKQPADAPYIAKCAMSQNDYHTVVKQKLAQLEEQLCNQYGKSIINEKVQHRFCDSAPILERRWAQRAGLGWIGKNKQFVNKTYGSYTHIGILLLNDVSDAYDECMENGCGQCEACLQACPTGAISSDKMFDAGRCISYLTVERQEPLRNEYKVYVENSLFGCDVCAAVCPWNRSLRPNEHPELAINELFLKMTRQDWESCTPEQRKKLLKRQAI